jgi:Fe-S oxidoreductase
LVKNRIVEPMFVSKTAEQWGKFALFEGCTMSRRQVGSRFATVFILDKYGFDYELIEKEKCCGSPVKRSGDEEIADELRDYNLMQVAKMGLKKMVTACPGCGSQLKSERSEHIGIEVRHFVEILYDLARNKELFQPEQMHNPPPPLTITAHFPCHFDRGMGVCGHDIYKTIVEAIRGWEYVEMEEADKCCGAGGGVRASQKDLSFEIRERKIKFVQRSGAKICMAPCPFCELQIDEKLRETLEEDPDCPRAITPQGLLVVLFKDLPKEVEEL